MYNESFDDPATSAGPSAGLQLRLSAMMFLEFFIWGAWFPQSFGYLGLLNFTSLEQSLILNAFAVASFTAMFFSTQFADRYFAAEKFMALSHLIGGVAMLGLVVVTDFWSFFGLMLVHSLFYVPTISISNAIAFASLKDAKREFGLVRLWGTIGWIAASLPWVFLFADWAKIPPFGTVPFTEWLPAVFGNALGGEAMKAVKPYIFLAGGLASLLLAALSLGLPHTPPRPAQQGENQLAWLEAMKLLRLPFVFVLFVVTFIDAAVHQGYFILTEKFLVNIGIPANWAPLAMTVGQVAEILTMAILGLVLKRLGWRMTMVLGVLGHTARFGVFALAPSPVPAVAVILLHGICYAFFFATVYIFVDEFFPKDARNSAQGLFNFLILGAGPFVGNFVWPFLEGSLTTTVGDQKVIDYSTLFLYPAATALVAAVLLLVFFRPPSSGTEGAEDVASGIEPTV
jgi:nucleoside transporter